MREPRKTRSPRLPLANFLQDVRRTRSRSLSNCPLRSALFLLHSGAPPSPMPFTAFFLRLLFALLIPGTLLALPPVSPIKVLVIEGASNHDWQRRVDIFRNILSRDGSFQMDVSIVPQDMESPEWAAWNPRFSNYDVVLSGYRNAAGNATWPRRRANRLRRLRPERRRILCLPRGEPGVHRLAGVSENRRPHLA